MLVSFGATPENSRFKKGEDQTRTPKKIANVDKWFVKLDKDFTEFLAYFA